MNNPAKPDSSPPENRADRQGKVRNFSAPLGTLKNGRLVFASGANQISLTSRQMMGDLCQACFRYPFPSVWLREDTLTIQYQHQPVPEQPVSSDELLSDLILTDAIPWDIEFHSSVSALKADLRRLRIHSLDYLGGASQVELGLSIPTGTAFIYISGGLSQSVISRPSGVSMRINISGSVSELSFDDQRLGTAGGEISLESPNFRRATERYEICITGGASQVRIREERSHLA